MSEPSHVLATLGQALSAMRFYNEGHPARERAISAAFEEVELLLEEDRSPRFTFVEGEAVYHRRLLRELRDWDWASKLEAAGVQRIEFTPAVTIEDYQRFLRDLVDRMNGGGGWNAVAQPDRTHGHPLRRGGLPR